MDSFVRAKSDDLTAHSVDSRNTLSRSRLFFIKDLQQARYVFFLTLRSVYFYNILHTYFQPGIRRGKIVRLQPLFLNSGHASSKCFLQVSQTYRVCRIVLGIKSFRLKDLKRAALVVIPDKNEIMKFIKALISNLFHC